MSAPRHIVILGAGPGGYVAAIRAAQLGARVTLIERQALGGVCLNAGCIPSKTLLSVVELGEKVTKAMDAGLLVDGPPRFDLVRMVARKNTVVSSLVKGIATLLKSWNVTVVQGTGRLVTATTVAVTAPDGTVQSIQGDAVIVATGSSWPALPKFPVDGRQIITSNHALDRQERPESLVILGGGVEGCEFARLYAGLGSQVTVVELQPRLLPLEDADMSAVVDRELRKRNVTVLTGVSIERVQRDDAGITATLTDGTTLTATCLLVSVGRGFHSRDIGLESLGVAMGRRGEVLVDAQLQTSVPGLYAIGDVTGVAMLAHVASEQGKVAVESIFGKPRAIDYNVVPAGIFTVPEIGRVGLTEQQARERETAAGRDPDRSLAVGRFRFQGLGKAQATGETAGLCKVIAEADSGRLLGVHIAGAHAADLIHEAALAMRCGATAEALATMIHAHPTYAEGLMEAAEDVHGLAIHSMRKRPGHA
ncbi:MAG: dihydrolipoyl dehydrogenase [Nitrospiraceae bacterium]